MKRVRRGGHGELYVVGYIDACKKDFYGFPRSFKDEISSRGKYFPFCVCTEIRTGNIYLPPLLS